MASSGTVNPNYSINSLQPYLKGWEPSEKIAITSRNKEITKKISALAVFGLLGVAMVAITVGAAIAASRGHLFGMQVSPMFMSNKVMILAASSLASILSIGIIAAFVKEKIPEIKQSLQEVKKNKAILEKQLDPKGLKTFISLNVEKFDGKQLPADLKAIYEKAKKEKGG